MLLPKSAAMSPGRPWILWFLSWKIELGYMSVCGVPAACYTQVC